jgi:Cu2+-exporting ATPase
VARALSAALTAEPETIRDARERPGYGVEGTVGGRRARLGRATWVAEIGNDAPLADGTAFAFAGGAVAVIGLRETLRAQARQAVDLLRRAGVSVEVVSGDAAKVVEAAAAQAGIDAWRPRCTPAEKVARLLSLAASGERVLMVGDGLNDAPALAAAHVSMAPATAADIGRMAADLVFTRDGLDAVSLAHDTALRSASLVRQNLALAILYNCIAVPVAVAGLVTPLLAAVAMSASSILVVGNALRLAVDGTAFRRVRPASLQEKHA